MHGSPLTDVISMMHTAPRITSNMVRVLRLVFFGGEPRVALSVIRLGVVFIRFTDIWADLPQMILLTSVTFDDLCDWKYLLSVRVIGK